MVIFVKYNYVYLHFNSVRCRLILV